MTEDPTASPHGGQRAKIRPWAADVELRYKFWQLAAGWALVMAILLSFNANTRSLTVNTGSLRASVQSTMLNNVISLDKVFVDDPNLYQYFYEGKTPTAADYQKTVAVAQLFADVLDMVSDDIPKLDDPAAQAAWDAWITDMLRQSPALCGYLEKHRAWYSAEFVRRLERAKATPPRPRAGRSDAH
jgi:hypothetical protein